ncbi:MAG: EboA domain-containing protein [Deltaproteobacteria bacterium]|nr:EboA domain-containing protein [Deltaproteobacteria bacterium]MCW5807013.1 EboA domain-containing protein [Deltaproteobacteria bacterium]
MADPTSELVDIVARLAPPEGVAWLMQKLLFDETTFHATFAAAGRRLGKAQISEADAERLARIDLPWPVETGADEAGRAALLVSAIGALEPRKHLPLVADLLRRGEVRERQAVLRVLAVLPDPGRFVDAAIDAYRTNVRSVFDALACDNEFPARHFPDAALFQMTLKALFVGAPVARIVGLPLRVTAELVRMVEAFASERRAAGRPVPSDVELIREIR